MEEIILKMVAFLESVRRGNYTKNKSPRLPFLILQLENQFRSSNPPLGG